MKSAAILAAALALSATVVPAEPLPVGKPSGPSQGAQEARSNGTCAWSSEPGGPVGTSISTDSEIDLDLRAVEISAGDFRRLRDRGGDRHKLRDRALPLFSGWPRRRGWLGSLILRTSLIKVQTVDFRHLACTGKSPSAGVHFGRCVKGNVEN